MPALLVLLLLPVDSASHLPKYTGLPNSCDYQLGVCLQHVLLTPHFAVFFNTTGFLAVTPEWAANVSMMAESAYAKLVVQDGFPAPPRNPIPIYLDRATGGFTNYLLCGVCQPSAAELAHLQIEYRYKSPCPVDCGIPTSNWEVAHEFFHAIQFTQFNGSLPFGTWLAEGSANWAGYNVAGNESRWDPWVISAWLGPNATTEKSLEERRYDNAFFLVFLSDHFGGTETVKRIISSANRETRAEDVIVGQLRALGYDKTLGQVMNEFARAMLTGNFTDRDGAVTVLRGLPPVGATTTWTGTNQTVSVFTNSVNGFTAGDALYVQIAGGMEFARIKPDSATGLSVQLSAQDRSCFDASVVARKGNGSTIYRMDPSNPALVPSPDKFDEIFVVVTRDACASGLFSIDLGTFRPREAGLLPSWAGTAALIAVAVALLILMALTIRSARRRKAKSDLKV